MNDIIFNRVWAMPNKHTFTILPIKKLLNRYITYDGCHWVDPFSSDSKFANITNDLDTESNAMYHMDALEFSKQLADNSLNGVLFDPPYSPRQVSECYKKMGMTVNMQTTQSSFWSKIKDELAKKILINGYVICCGWNSNGFGINRGFELIEILLVPHGGAHSDTIVTVERKISSSSKTG